jgi:polyhydroxybutyrate depolymerase
LLLEIVAAGILVAAAIALIVCDRQLRFPSPVEIAMPGNRRALLYRLPGGPRPTLVVLHPYSGDARSTAKYSGFLQTAIPHGFNVVVPDAVANEWHDSPQAQTCDTDDIRFIASLVENLVADQIADRRRVFVAGISNGGMMAFTMVWARPDLFAGIGTISAGMPKHAFESYRAAKAMPLIMVNGDGDDVLPYEGGELGEPSGFFRNIASVEQTAALFARANGCAAIQAKRTRIRDRSRQIERIHWDCPPNCAVTVTRIIGGGHDVIGWRAPVQAFLGLPPRGPATAAAIVQRFAEFSRSQSRSLEAVT